MMSDESANSVNDDESSHPSPPSSRGRSPESGVRSQSEFWHATHPSRVTTAAVHSSQNTGKSDSPYDSDPRLLKKHTFSTLFLHFFHTFFKKSFCRLFADFFPYTIPLQFSKKEVQPPKMSQDLYLMTR